MKIRIATPADAPAILDIYAPFVISSHITFEWEVPSRAEIEKRIGLVLETHPWLVGEIDGRVAGYAYSHHFRSRISYQWSTESSVFVHEKFRGQGVGRRLYGKLFDLLREQGHYNVYAGIALPNAASIALHEALGFRSQGVLTNSGYKLGKWHDLGWWYLPLRETAADPAPVKIFPELKLKTGASL